MSSQLKIQLENKFKEKEETINRKNTLAKRIEEDKNQILELDKDIKNILGVGNISTSSVSSNNVDITIIIGKDYK